MCGDSYSWSCSQSQMPYEHGSSWDLRLSLQFSEMLYHFYYWTVSGKHVSFQKTWMFMGMILNSGTGMDVWSLIWFANTQIIWLAHGACNYVLGSFINLVSSAIWCSSISVHSKFLHCISWNLKQVSFCACLCLLVVVHQNCNRECP